MPWRPQPSRIPAFTFTQRFYQRLLPRAEFVFPDSSGEGFNLAEARNRGARQANGDLLLIVDADSIAQPATILAALRGTTDGRMHYAFDRFAYLTESQSQLVMRGRHPGHLPGAQHESSVMAISIDAYWRAGGSDERFTTWGGEDNALRIACDTMLGPSRWHPGLGMTLWHQVDTRQASLENLALVAHYRAAWKRPEMMRRILAEPGRHLSMEDAA